MQLTVIPASHVQFNNKSNKNRSIQPKRVCLFGHMTEIPVKDEGSEKSLWLTTSVALIGTS